MAAPQLKYLPAGSLLVSRCDSALPDQDWNNDELKCWSTFAPASGSSVGLDCPTRLLRQEVQINILACQIIKPYARLFRASWIHFDFKKCEDNPDFGTVRVYLLPDDTDRRTIDRSDPSLMKLRHTLMANLNYSPEAWSGYFKSEITNKPFLYDANDQAQSEEENVSLLDLFNSIPSPKPAPEVVSEQYHRDAMNSILDGKIAGLRTDLRDYQRRSAALMMQKETQPGSILDPRLIHVKDQLGAGWYTDFVSGTVLREARVYDGISGGILAEEMGAGKTLICLALILATRSLPTRPPALHAVLEPPRRERIASLADMAAACATRNAVPWKPYFDRYSKQLGEDFTHCINALRRHPGCYRQPQNPPRRTPRFSVVFSDPPKQIFLSSGTVVIVPDNLLAQWKQEVHKHTNDLELLVMTRKDELPGVRHLLKYDIILFSQSGFEMLVRQFGGIESSALSHIHFKRCIVDEGHKLGNSRLGQRSNLLIGLDALLFSSRWIVTGTPSHGLYGVDLQDADEYDTYKEVGKKPKSLNENSLENEKKDLERIGSIAALYLKARPWANTRDDAGDTRADWTVYLMLPKHNSKSQGRWENLKSTINSLVIRHQVAEIVHLLPPVDERVVVLDGSYQDQLSLNMFSMMIIFNSVQSQRTDMDYFFHPKQRRSLLEIVSNLKQASFFGASFFSHDSILKAVETAEKFLEEGKIPISPEDRLLLEQAIEFGHTAMKNDLRNIANSIHEMPVMIEGLSAGIGQAWSLDGQDGAVTCSSASMLLALQKLIQKSASAPEQLNALLNGRLVEEGALERERILEKEQSQSRGKSSSRNNTAQTLAGNIKSGDGSARKPRSHGVNDINNGANVFADIFLGPIESSKILSTVSAKMSYLIDSIIKYQDDEKIIVFYENDNTAWYLSALLDVLQVQHLIYAKGLSTDRRSRYVNTFNHNPAFRVLLMDITQAAFGLDMRAASRLYFINPVLNPQVEAQAIGRVRRISQSKPVSVETLVLKNSIEEVIIERKSHMTQAEHRKAKSILDIRPIYNWIKNATILPLPDVGDSKSSQMAPLQAPQSVFSRGFGRTMHPDDGLVPDHAGERNTTNGVGKAAVPEATNTTAAPKRPHDAETVDEADDNATQDASATGQERPARRVRFTAGSDED